jgi:hypothetical protein
MPVAEVDQRAVAQLSEQTVVLGNRLQVRQTIDIFRGVDHGARRAAVADGGAGDGSGDQGGSATDLGNAVLLSPELHRRAHDAGVLRVLDEAQAVAVAIAVGDGFDIGVVASYPVGAAAVDAVSQIKAQASELSERALVKLLRLDRFVAPLVAVAVRVAEAQDPRATPGLSTARR